MPEPSVFEFRFIDEGAPSTPPVPGSAARAGAPVTTPPPSSRAQAGSQPQQRTSSTGPQSSAGIPAGSQPRPPIQLPMRVPPVQDQHKILAGAVDRAIRATPLGKYLAAGDKFAKPLWELAVAVRGFRQPLRQSSLNQRTTSIPQFPVLPRQTSPFPAAGAKPLPMGRAFSSLSSQDLRDIVAGKRGPATPIGTTNPVPADRLQTGTPFSKLTPQQVSDILAGKRGPAQSPIGIKPPLRPIPVAPAAPLPNPRGGVPTLPSIGSGAARAVATQAAVPAAGAAATGGVAGLAVAAAAAVVPLAALVVAVGATVLSLRALYRRANENAKAFAAYDATLASAQARASVASVRQDIRSAHYLGKDLAKFTDAQVRLEISWRQQVDKLEKAFLPIATSAIGLLADVVAGVQKTEDVLGVLGEVASGTTSVLKIGQRLVDISQERKDSERDAYIRAGDFFGLFNDLQELDISDPTGNVNNGQVPRGAPANAGGFGSLPRFP